MIYYVDGVSITYGSAPRKHLWTYAAAPVDHNITTHYGFYRLSMQAKQYYHSSSIHWY